MLNKEVKLFFPTSYISDSAGYKMVDAEFTEQIFFDSSQYSQELAKTGIILSASTYNTDYLKNNLSNLGFNTIKAYNYDEYYKGDTVAFAIGKLNNIVAVVIRGTSGVEWYSNFNVGMTHTHRGFDFAADYVKKVLYEYIIENELESEDIIFYITGHSRGGAVANLLSKKLIDTNKNVYSYTFASPGITTKNDVSDNEYSGIFNIINPLDFITCCPLPQWGFKRYGTDLFVKNVYEIEKFRSDFLLLTGIKYESITTPEHIKKVTDNIYFYAKNLWEYYNKKYEVGFRSVTFYDYMTIIAQIINKKNLFENGLLMLQVKGTPFEFLTEFLLQGVNFESIVENQLPVTSIITYTHSPETYYCILNLDVVL